MLNMSQINHIKDLHQSGYRISEIDKETGIDHKTISKYIVSAQYSGVYDASHRNEIMGQTRVS